MTSLQCPACSAIHIHPQKRYLRRPHRTHGGEDGGDIPSSPYSRPDARVSPVAKSGWLRIQGRRASSPCLPIPPPQAMGSSNAWQAVVARALGMHITGHRTQSEDVGRERKEEEE
jgi:hypothetical protein